MLYIRNDCDEPYFNLALEEYVLKKLNLEEDCLLLWQNKPSVIIGRFQNTVDEVNVDYVQKNNLNVVRRITGGETVYNDYGTINLSLIEKAPTGLIDSNRFTVCIVNALNNLGIMAEPSGRNNIVVADKKIGWNAYHHYNRKILHHGSLLFIANLRNMQEALSAKQDKVVSKGANSGSKKVGSILDYFEDIVSVEQFKSALLNEIFKGGLIKEYQLTKKDLDKVKELSVEKYLTWQWNYGTLPVFNIKKHGRFTIGKIVLYLSVEEGFIKGCRVYGDFLGSEEIGAFEAGLIGVRYEKKAVESIISTLNIKCYFGELGKDELTRLFF